MAVALMSAFAAPGAATADTVTVANGAIFNDPSGTTAEQDKIRDHVVSLVNDAPAGSTVQMSMYTFTDDVLRTALIAAKDRGVAVKLVVDYKSHNFKPDGTELTKGGEYENLAAALGTDRTKASWILSCPQGRGCIANRKLNSDDDGSINHNKFFLFSHTGGADNVVVQTSANMSGTQRTDLFNNAVTLVDAGLYANYQAYFNDQVANGSSGAGDNNYYSTPVSSTDPDYKTYFFPRKETSGTTYSTDPATDTVKLILDKVTCSSTQHSEVRMAANLFYRDQIATKLAAMVDAGCKVYLAADANPNGGGTGLPSMGKTVESILYGQLTQRVECFETPPAGHTVNIGIHSKYLLVNGTYEGVANEKVVWTGSHNYSWQALRSNDETILKINDDAVYDQFKANHDQLMSYCAGS
ncbi:phosphatidylserine/phosphatidylglycerophosphate/cardiolipin synthase family protein [Streptomyces sp. NPDC059994]|uniref:phospholipase D-like domain-containing protein n=1 Tax=Streptomyces sp. NPDC059994 TaxID=3347029 RepID=UPI0036BD0FA1